MTSDRMLADSRGFATVAAAAVIAALVTVLLLVFYLGAAVAARHRAQSAADLVALAGAQAAVWGEADPCAAATDLAGRQEGTVTVDDCRLDGEDLVVSVAVPIRVGPLGVRRAEARARAGPADQAGVVTGTAGLELTDPAGTENRSTG